MKSFLKFSLLGLLTALLLQPVSANSPVTVADNVDVKTGTQKIEQSQSALSTIEKDEALSPAEKIELGISARRDIVLDALTLSLHEVNSIKANLAKLPEFEEVSREKELQDEFFLQIDTFNNYYSEKFDEITNNPNPTLEEIKATAQALIDYRETIYKPAVKKIVDFTLFFYNKDVITAVNIYLEKISADIKKFEKLNLLKVNLFKADLDQVALLIQGAHDLQKAAGVIIFADPVEITEEVVVDSFEDTILEEVDTVAVDPNILITESLNKVRSSYEILLQTISGMRKSLGIK